MDGTLYCGSTTDIKRRLNEHDAGKGGKYTRTRYPVELIALAGPLPNRSRAFKLEYQIKKLNKNEKAKMLKRTNRLLRLDIWA